MGNSASLHIGLNGVDPGHYDGWAGPLGACEADAHSMQTICAQRGFDTTVLLTAQATRGAVTSALRGYAASLQPGGTLVISYSGHGGQLPDLNGDEQDGLDETWCLFDGQLVDDELYEAWAAFRPGVRIAVFSDSCHSGTILRNALVGSTAAHGDEGTPDPVGYRLMPPPVQRRTYAANKTFYDALLTRPAPPPSPSCSVLLVSGCQDNQLSQDGVYNGAFTGALLVTWNNGRFNGGYAELTKAVRSHMPSTQSPNFMTVGAKDDIFVSAQAFTP